MGSPIRNQYGAVAMVMLATMALGVVGLLFNDDFIHWLFWPEAALILEFAVFWIMQTLALEGRVSRRTLRPSPQ